MTNKKDNKSPSIINSLIGIFYCIGIILATLAIWCEGTISKNLFVSSCIFICVATLIYCNELVSN
jgi:hypothetical protein